MSVSVIGSDAYRLDESHECGWQADRLGPAMIAILVEYRNLGALRAWYPFLTVSTSLWDQFKEKRQGGILYPGSIERTLATVINST